jgi:hypothetical protein
VPEKTTTQENASDQPAQRRAGCRSRRHPPPMRPGPGILERLLVLNAAIWHNWAIGAPPVKRSLIAYDH